MQMTITRALNELKLLNSRIDRAISEARFVTYNKKSAVKVQSIWSKEEFIEKGKSSYASIVALIKRRNNIKKLIVASNAQVIVQIGTESMTVAAAIERKVTIEYENNLLNTLEHQFRNAQSNLNNENEKVQAKLDKLLETEFGKDTKGTVNKDSIESITEPYLKNNEFELIDALGIEKIIEKTRKEVEDFENEVDFVLSENNSIVKIEVED